MSENKYCQCCGKYLGNVNEMDYYRFIRLKYCPECADMNKKLKDKDRAREVRRITKEKHKAVEIELQLIKEKNKLLESENEILRKKIIELRENCY